LLSIIGYIISFCWFLSTKGSKFWQENYENHIYQLEKIKGINLMANQFRKETCCSEVFSAERYSVSKINTFISVVITISWLIIGIKEISVTTCYLCPLLNYLLICLLFTIIIPLLTKSKNNNQTIKINDVEHNYFEVKK
jgi:hypothetical protein